MSNRKFNLRKVRVSPELAIGTLTTDTALTVGMTSASPNKYRCISVDVVWSLSALTANEGPLTVGYAHSDYSTTEIKECMEAAGALDQGNKIAQEQANRLVRVIGTLDSELEQLNQGAPLKTKLNWLIGIGDVVNAFVFNEQTGTLTTGASLKISGNMWIKD